MAGDIKIDVPKPPETEKAVAGLVALAGGGAGGAVGCGVAAAVTGAQIMTVEMAAQTAGAIAVRKLTETTVLTIATKAGAMAGISAATPFLACALPFVGFGLGVLGAYLTASHIIEISKSSSSSSEQPSSPPEPSQQALHPKTV